MRLARRYSLTLSMSAPSGGYLPARTAASRSSARRRSLREKKARFSSGLRSTNLNRSSSLVIDAFSYPDGLVKRGRLYRISREKRMLRRVLEAEGISARAAVRRIGALFHVAGAAQADRWGRPGPVVAGAGGGAASGARRQRIGTRGVGAAHDAARAALAGLADGSEVAFWT